VGNAGSLLADTGHVCDAISSTSQSHTVFSSHNTLILVLHYITSITSLSARLSPLSHMVFPRVLFLGLFSSASTCYSNIIHHHGFKFHCYTDATQLCIHSQRNSPFPINSISACIYVIKTLG